MGESVKPEIDRDKLVAWLEERAQVGGQGEAPFLVLYATYMGLASRIKDGQFDRKAD